MSLTTNRKGAIAETAITAEATRLGIDVYRPVSEGGRFDLIFAFEDALARVQCKWANLVRGVVPYGAIRAAERARVCGIARTRPTRSMRWRPTARTTAGPTTCRSPWWPVGEWSTCGSRPRPTTRRSR